MPSKLKQQRERLESKMREYFDAEFREWCEDNSKLANAESLQEFADEMDGIAGLDAASIRQIAQY